jgi:Copper type II ascorbate-dependent monooxygenase, C-terminal domain
MKTATDRLLPRIRPMSLPITKAVLSAALACAALSCSEDPAGAESGPSGSTDKTLERTESTARPATSTLLEAPKAGRGEQFTMGTEIAAGDERESCLFVRTRAPMIVNRDEIRFTSGSHHVLLFLTQYEEIPTKDLTGAAVDTSGVFDCTQGVQGFWALGGLVGASQNASGKSAISFPDGVGLRVPANSVLMFNVHYINATDHAVTPEVAVNLHSIPEAELKEEGGLLFWYNPFIKVPANGHSVMTASCPLSSNVKLTNLQSHMHRRGTNYRATLISAEQQRNEIYTSTDWEDVEVAAFSPSIDAKSGSRLEWTCEYENPEARDVYQGPRSTDEMCMLIGSYYPLEPTTSFCSRGESAFFGAEWSVGQGEASCAQSLGCLAATMTGDMLSTTGAEGKTQSSMVTDCLIASKPSIAGPLSAAVGCLGAAGDDGVAKCGAEIAECMTAE